MSTLRFSVSLILQVFLRGGLVKRAIFFLCCCAQFTFATDPIYIPLGSSCVPGLRLNECSLRLAAYPFDWLISPFDAVYATIEEDFSRFFTGLELVPDASGAKDSYGHLFIHDWRIKEHPSVDLAEVDWVPSNTIIGDWQEYLPLIREKYKRRIERFEHVLNSERNIVFVRYNEIDKESSIKLRDLIRNKYPNLKFVLVVVKFDPEFVEPWDIEHIKNFSIEHNDCENWVKIFKQVALEFNEV
jgi:hypothetical protein